MERREDRDEIALQESSMTDRTNEEPLVDSNDVPEDTDSGAMIAAPESPNGSNPESLSGDASSDPVAGQATETTTEAIATLGTGNSEVDAAPGDLATPQLSNVIRHELPAQPLTALARPMAAPRDRHARLLPIEHDESADGESGAIDNPFASEPVAGTDFEHALRPANSAISESTGAADEGQLVPRIQVMVSLADARAMYADAITEVLDRKAAQFKQVARSEVEQGFWEYNCERRAADWRLRGPW